KDVYLYEKKILFVKNPNEYINDSQRKRAIEFFERIWKYFGKSSIKFEKNKKRKFEDFGEFLKSIKKDFGSYQERRKELLAKGRKWFKNRVEKWKKYKVIPEKKFKDLEIIYPEGKTFKFGKTKIKFSEPRFHGIEYSRTGWVFSLVVEEGRKKFLYTSDLNGPIIEDYADWIIKENPNFLVIDGPMTYMLGYTLNRTNLRRVLENMKRIVEKVKFEILIWDHHLTREPLFRKHTELVWEIAKKKKKKVLTAREFKFGKKPVVESFS
ncbi:MAG: MBL fold metallo-hydrolase, partial [Candidatus Aenigmarchaeota archaeon ex4484_224]